MANGSNEASKVKIRLVVLDCIDFHFNQEMSLEIIKAALSCLVGVRQVSVGLLLSYHFVYVLVIFLNNTNEFSSDMGKTKYFTAFIICIFEIFSRSCSHRF